MTIYLDYQATTPVAPEVAAAMRPWIETNFANPHSPHRLGRAAAAAVEVARDQILSALSPSVPGKLHFTSGATEAANWALKGAAARLPPDRRRIITWASEHAAVLDTIRHLADLGFEVEVYPVEPDGLIDLDRLDHVLARDVGLVAVMLVNNEIGVIQRIPAIAAMAQEVGALLFCDAVQGFGRVPLPIDDCDMVAISAHKVHGPKGIGALWLKDKVAVDPLLHGGGQEGGVRSGTLSPALCVGFGEAARLLQERRDEDHEHVERLWSTARSEMHAWSINGSVDHRYHGNFNISRQGVDAARLISEVRSVAFSAGSACASGSGRPSHVLAAIGLTPAQARSSIRLGFGRYTEEEDLRTALAAIDEAAEKQLRFAA